MKNIQLNRKANRTSKYIYLLKTFEINIKNNIFMN
jgi:hypothetical protein